MRRAGDVIKTFQDQDQNLNFKTKTLIFFQDQYQACVQDQGIQDFASQEQDLFVMYTRGRPKTFIIFDRKRKCRRKWNSIYGRKRKWTFIFGRKRKQKSPDNNSVFFLFHTFSHQLSQPYNAPPIPRPVSPFLQVVLVDGIPLSSCRPTVFICGIFLDDISTRKQFVFLVYCYRVKAIFHNLCCTGVCVT